jgi:DNA topoisomerase-1
MTRDEILYLYSKVHPGYRTKTFWKNFQSLCSKRGWGRSLGEMKKIISEKYKPPTPQPPPHGDTYKFCTTMDGRREPITNWKMEPPSVFIGRGQHELRGCLKTRIIPEDITLNLHSKAKLPKLPPGRSWGGVVHREDLQWLWSWMDPLTGKNKYVYPSALSENHAERERDKFDEAMVLEKHIENIRKFYNQSLAGREYLELSCALYIIDHLGIRVGNEYNNNTDGATTLRVKGVRVLNDRGLVRINFIGKDSIEYDNQLNCSRDFIRGIQTLSRDRDPEDYLFPNLSPRILNEYLQSHHPSITAKSFRTFNATNKFRELIYKYRQGRDNPVEWFKKCATEVAVYCNHKKISTINKAMEKYSPTTSITNYIDPRVVVGWAERFNVPLEKLYSKTLLERFSWAYENSKEDY